MNICSQTQTASAAIENTCIVVTLNQEKKLAYIWTKFASIMQVKEGFLEMYLNIL